MIRRALRDARTEAGLSQAALAKLAGIGRDHYGRVERGEEALPDALADRIAPYVKREPWEISSDYRGMTEREYAVLRGLRHIRNRDTRDEAFRIILAMLDEWSRSNAA